MIFHNNNVASVMVGDCLASLKTIPDRSVNCCVTSPPYFGLRDYGCDGQIGLEETPDAYIARLVAVFREVRRVMADDGTLWVNIGDSYGKSKSLTGIPWMLAFALRADGWYLRQEIIWHKPNPMPESVTDRCTKSHEQLFLLTKSPRYFYDADAVKEPAVCGHNPPGNKSHRGATEYDAGDERHRTKSGLAAYAAKVRESRKRGEFNGKTEALDGRNAFRAVVDMRNRRSVWTIATRPYSGAHFAVFPPALVEPCILAGCPAGGVVLDPFGGSGTTAGVALLHGRHAIMLELNPDYAALMPERVKHIIEKHPKPILLKAAA